MKKRIKNYSILPKKNKIIYSTINNSRFNLDYLGKIQRKRIEKHLAQEKTLKCHHRNCSSFNEESTTLYAYNIHCYNSNHASQPIHPELPLIELFNLEPRGNPWEEVVKNDTYLPLSNSNKLDQKFIRNIIMMFIITTTQIKEV